MPVCVCTSCDVELMLMLSCLANAIILPLTLPCWCCQQGPQGQARLFGRQRGGRGRYRQVQQKREILIHEAPKERDRETEAMGM